MDNNNRDKELVGETSIDIELKRGIYKLENEDIAGAESIFENLALTHNVPMAWIYIGGIKLGQLDSGKTSVNQALNCFLKASELLPELREKYQETYCDLSLQQIERFCNYYLETKQQRKKAKSNKIWSAVLMGLSVGYGNKRSDNNNNVFRGMTGAAGAAYSFQQMNKSSIQKTEAENRLSFLENTITQLIKGVDSFCSDNQGLYQRFVGRINDRIKELNLTFPTELL